MIAEYVVSDPGLVEEHNSVPMMVPIVLTKLFNLSIDPMVNTTPPAIQPKLMRPTTIDIHQVTQQDKPLPCLSDPLSYYIFSYMDD